MRVCVCVYMDIYIYMCVCVCAAARYTNFHRQNILVVWCLSSSEMSAVTRVQIMEGAVCIPHSNNNNVVKDLNPVIISSATDKF